MSTCLTIVAFVLFVALNVFIVHNIICIFLNVFSYLCVACWMPDIILYIRSRTKVNTRKRIIHLLWRSTSFGQHYTGGNHKENIPSISLLCKAQNMSCDVFIFPLPSLIKANVSSDSWSMDGQKGKTVYTIFSSFLTMIVYLMNN